MTTSSGSGAVSSAPARPSSPCRRPPVANRRGLPEDHVYEDHGCRLSPRCAPLFNFDADGKMAPVPGTGCPLPACIYDRARSGATSYVQEQERALRDGWLTTLL